MKKKLRELIEKDSLSPILLETIMAELVRQRNSLNIVLENLNERGDELSETTMNLPNESWCIELENIYSKNATRKQRN